jgi:hypothetical protein
MSYSTDYLAAPPDVGDGRYRIAGAGTAADPLRQVQPTTTDLLAEIARLEMRVRGAAWRISDALIGSSGPQATGYPPKDADPSVYGALSELRDNLGLALDVLDRVERRLVGERVETEAPEGLRSGGRVSDLDRYVSGVSGVTPGYPGGVGY